MANSPQSKKRARQNDRNRLVNKNRRSRIRTFIRKVEEAIAGGDKESALVALRSAQPELMRGVSKRNLSQKYSSAKNVAFGCTRERDRLSSAKCLNF